MFSSFRSPFLPSQSNVATARFANQSSIKSLISCHLENSRPREGDDDEMKKKSFDLLQIYVTLTVFSTSLPQKCLAAKGAQKKKSSKKVESITLQELKTWSEGLPVVEERLPYTEVLTLNREGRLKHIIKHPQAGLKEKSVVAIVILDDSRAFRTVLPSIKTDEEFWQSWINLKIDSLCVNAFSPPFKEAELPKPYLPDLRNAYKQLCSFISKKLQQKKTKKRGARSEELNNMQQELEKIRRGREMMDKARREQEKMAARQRRMERRKRLEESMSQSVGNSEDMADLWASLASNSTLTTGIGLLFFYVFYRTVVLGYRKQKKDYEDRLKIEKAEAEERRETRRLEREMEEAADEEFDARGKQNTQEKLAKQFMQSGARVRRMKGRKLPQFLERDVDVKFKDVAGLGKIRLELEEIVKFFTHKEIYHRRGVKIPGGILLCGPPGVGKTLLAKAVAGEAGVNFFSISASQFVEIYVGVGAARVRTLYQEANENAPSVVFIDELDAVGRKRGLIKGSGGQERDATLNQLLICLDGFEGRGDVVTIASTNRPDILDDALVRPGRFDRKIQIPKPSKIGRVEILQVHSSRKPMAEDVDYMAVANMTDGMVGAELANIVEVAALQMIRDRRDVITTDDLLQAAQIEERGMLDKIERSPDMWRQVAINEAATAVVAVNFTDFRSVEFITISPRAGRELGYVRFRTDPVKFQEGMISRRSILHQITIHLAPRAADEIWHGKDQLSTIWAQAANNARSAARKLVLSGLSDKNCGLPNFWTQERIKEIDVETSRVLEMCYEQAKEILLKNKELMNAVVDKLVQQKSLSKQDFFELVDLHGSLMPSPPSIIDVRNAKRKQLQELITVASSEQAT